MSDHPVVPVLTLAAARAMVDSVLAAATALDKSVAVTVLDAAGTIVAAARMDGARMIASVSCVAKARTALLFGAASADLVGAVQPGAALFGIESSSTEPLAFIPGGVPVLIDGHLVGAIGVGGAAPAQDHAMADQASSNTSDRSADTRS
jgi:uncharacterized protein GlcG (DUF336 family)